MLVDLLSFEQGQQAVGDLARESLPFVLTLLATLVQHDDEQLQHLPTDTFTPNGFKQHTVTVVPSI